MKIRKMAALALMTGIFALAAFACTSAPASPAPSAENTPIVQPTTEVVPPIVEPIESPTPEPVEIPSATPVPPAPEPTETPEAEATPEIASTVIGTVTYRERIVLSPNAVVEVKLLDISRPGAPAVTLGEQTIENPGQVPVSFEIEYDPSEIDDRFTYAVRATITEGGELSFTSTSVYPVITRGNSNEVDLVLEKVASQEVAPATASVTGTVTYLERIALRPDAIVQIQLVDVSRADAPAIVLGEQTIENPGQVPVTFEIEYDPSQIDDRFTYAIQARITEDGELSFINTSRYAVLTRDNPDHVELVLEKVDSTATAEAEETVTSPDPETVSVPAPIQNVEVKVSDSEPREYSLSVTSIQPRGSSCSDFEGYTLDIDGTDINVSLTNLEATGMMICTADLPIDQTEIPLGSEFEAGETYTVIVNGQVTNSFVARGEEAHEMAQKPSPIEDVQIGIPETESAEYSVIVISRLPLGSSCSKFAGYDVSRQFANTINITVSHLEVTAQNVPCTLDLPVVQTEIPLGNDFVSGETYEVIVNGEVTETFVAE